MGRFLEEFSRLKRDIDDSTAARMTFIDELGSGTADMKTKVADMQAGIRAAQEEMAGTAHRARTAFVSGLKAQVADLRNGFRQERHEMGRRARDARNASIGEIQGFVAELNRQVAAMQAAFRDTRMEMADTQQRDLQAVIGEIRQTVSDLKASARERQEQFRESFADDSQNDRDTRLAFVSKLKSDTARMRDDFHAAGKQRSQELGEELDATVARVRTFVSGLAENVSRMLDGFRERRIDTARRAESERTGFVAELAESVAQLREKVTDMREAFASDLAGARACWRGNGEDRHAERPHAAASAAPEAETPVIKAAMAGQEHSAAAPEAAEVHQSEADISLSEPDARETEAPDDLTAIQGIGPGRLRRLNDAGIYTFSQLAQSSVDTLNDALGEASRLVDVGKWIEQAKTML
jgi:predicted flap endonuclease-1-like 5' DNA nuclease